MIKNLTTVKLLGILAVLVLVYLGFEFFGGQSRSKNYREVLVEIDTSKVDKIVIEKAGNTLDLLKDNGHWKVGIGGNKYAEASEKTVRGTLTSLLGLKASRIVANDPEKWKEYQVDTTGTHVQVFEGDRVSLDLILGRLGFQSQREFSTYVRLANEDEIYAADDFMPMSINTDASRYRNSQVARVRKDSLASISFNYPDSSFTITNDSITWKIEGNVVDSASSVQFFNALTTLTSTHFYDEGKPEGPADLSVVFEKKDGATIEMRAWALPGGEWTLHSSQNPASYFKDENLFKKVFKGKDYFLGK